MNEWRIASCQHGVQLRQLRERVAQTGEVIVALVGDEATVKYLRKKGSSFYLEPANPRYSPKLVDPSVSIVGKVISVIRRF